jgi:type IV secretion system protein TrbL
MGGTGVIDQFANVFSTYIDSGFGLLRGEVAFLTSVLIGIDMTLAGLFWSLGAEEEMLARLVRKTLYVGFFAFLISNFNNLAKIVFNSFAGLGLEATGSSLSYNQFLQPGRIAQVGLDAGTPILQAVGQLMGFTSFFDNFLQIFILLIAWLVVIVAFFVLAVQLFVALIEFKLTTLAGFVLVPFGLFNRTAFLAERVLGNVVASGIKVLVLAVIVGIGTTLFSQFTQGFGNNQPSLETALSIVLASLSLLGLGIFGPSIASGLAAGAPQLGAGAVAGTALAAGGLGVAAAMGIGGGIGLVGAALRGGAAVARTGASVAGGAASAYHLGAATSGETGVKSAAAGIAGAGKAGIGAAAAPMRQTSERIANAFRARFDAGSRAAYIATGGNVREVGASVSGEASGTAPDWVSRMCRSQHFSHGLSASAHAVRSGDHGGGSTRVDLSEDR